MAKNGELWNPILLTLFDDEEADWPVDHPSALFSTQNETFDLSDYERNLMELRGAQRGHVRFLRQAKQKLNSRSSLEPTSVAIIGDERMILQEYPVDDLSCWLVSEDAVFDGEVVHIYETRRRAPLWIEQNGEKRIWERPVNGRPYVIFLDTSEGLPQSNWQAGAVLDVERLKFVAVLRCKMALADLARIVYELGISYNEALLMVERNNHGHAVLHALQEYLQYPNLYYHDESGLTASHLLGWPTNTRTKPLMVAEFKELFEAGALEIDDEDALREIKTFRYFDPRVNPRHSGQDRYGAPSGGTDDIVMAMMGAVQGRHLAFVANQAQPIRYGSIASTGLRRSDIQP